LLFNNKGTANYSFCITSYFTPDITLQKVTGPESDDNHHQFLGPC